MSGDEHQHQRPSDLVTCSNGHWHSVRALAALAAVAQAPMRCAECGSTDIVPVTEADWLAAVESGKLGK